MSQRSVIFPPPSMCGLRGSSLIPAVRYERTTDSVTEQMACASRPQRRQVLGPSEVQQPWAEPRACRARLHHPVPSPSAHPSFMEASFGYHTIHHLNCVIQCFGYSRRVVQPSPPSDFRAFHSPSRSPIPVTSSSCFRPLGHPTPPQSTFCLSRFACFRNFTQVGSYKT